MDWISHVKAVQKKKGISYKEAELSMYLDILSQAL